MSAQLSRRQFLQAGLGVVGTTLLAACVAPAGAPGTAAVEGVQPAQGPVNITLLSTISQVRRTYWDYNVKKVPELHPGTTLELIEVDGGEFDTKIHALVAAGTPIDLWPCIGPNNFCDYTYKGLVAPLDDLIEAVDPDLSDFYPELLEFTRVKGKLTGLPMSYGGSYVYYNTDILQEAGLPLPPSQWNTPDWTLDALLANALKLTKEYDDMQNAQFGIAAVRPGSLQPTFEEMCWLFGVDVWDKEAHGSLVKTVHLELPEAQQAIQWFADLINVHQVAPPMESFGALRDLGLFGLAGGRSAMSFGIIYQIGNFVNITEFKWGMGALPKGAGLKDAIYPDPILIAYTSPHHREAFEALMVLLSDDSLKILIDSALFPSPRKSHLDHFAATCSAKGATQDVDQIKECFLGSLEYGEFAPMNDMAGYNSFTWDILLPGFDPIFRGEKSAAEVLPELKKVQEAMLASLPYPGVPW
jgi:multiple sugar transport system substrate-binding protein